MNNQASDGITEDGKDLVLSCIKNPELCDHVRKCTLPSVRNI